MMQRRRRDLDIDQPTLATRIGVSQQTISRWEGGSNTPSRQYIKSLADALKVDEAHFHRIAGYAPDVAIQDVDQLFDSVVASIDQLSSQQLLDLLDLFWRTYRARADADHRAPTSVE
jgi:transcriptional regulator with XRE-family HTH domain